MCVCKVCEDHRGKTTGSDIFILKDTFTTPSTAVAAEAKEEVEREDAVVDKREKEKREAKRHEREKERETDMCDGGGGGGVTHFNPDLMRVEENGFSPYPAASKRRPTSSPLAPPRDT